ncbi:MAG: DUF2786 domain-containing protein [Acholeplasmatales bacterium]|jgi:hypothetical protein|nr:DUF2786 domain-containing protein [Acholeplasmatales bacterium]
MTREEVLSKIQKMLLLATNKGATENEAYVAMQQAQKLAIQYGMSLDEISLEEDKPKQEKIIEDYIMNFTYSTVYNKQLIRIIANNFRCEILVAHGNRIVRAILVGSETDVAIAKEVVVSAYRFMEKRAKEHSVGDTWLSKKYMNSYRLGFLDGLQSKYKDNLSKLKEEYPEVVKQDEEYGLVVVKPESLAEYMKPYDKKPSYKSSAQRNDAGRGTMAYSSGYQDGKGFGTQLQGGN